MKQLEFTILHLFGGVGGSALGTAASRARFAGHEARFKDLGSVDFNQQVCDDYEMLTGVKALCADVHTLTPAELLRYCPRCPDVVMMSPPCKGFSALLGAERAAQEHYQQMNMLLVDALFLLMSTWSKPPPLIFIENVPRIQSRGKHVLDIMRQTAQAHGYTIGEGNHDCGELGNLAQHRRRYFAVMRLTSAVKRFVYHVRKKPVRACGDVISPIAMPGNIEVGGWMHSVPEISWKNWVRLALIPAGGDYRDISGVLKPGQARRELFRRAPLTAWDQPTATVAGPGGSNIGAVSDPRIEEWGGGRGSARLGVIPFDRAAGTVRGESLPNNGAFSVADPRWHANVLGVNSMSKAVGTVTSQGRITTGRFAVADDRVATARSLLTRTGGGWQRVAGVTAWEDVGPTVTAGAKIHAGSFQVADPRWLAVGCTPRPGAYGVMSWQAAASTISGSQRIDNARAAIADPRLDDAVIKKSPSFIPVIVAEDGCWHRPFTTYELAMLQGFPRIMRNGQPFQLTGRSHTRARQGVGNAVPPPAAEEIGNQLLMALLCNKVGVPAIASGGVWADDSTYETEYRLAI